MFGFWITSCVDYTSPTECEAIAIHIPASVDLSVIKEARDRLCLLFGCAYSSDGNAAKQTPSQREMALNCAHAVNNGGSLWHPVYGTVSIRSYSMPDPEPPCEFCGCAVDADGGCGC